MMCIMESLLVASREECWQLKEVPTPLSLDVLALQPLVQQLITL
jgi:hypothetical protein